ncbi:MAG: hypothetical protein HYR89_11930 [Actinobacteria bacterium]|nr:hypothetical protein [Actinomycetota bacterium]
MDRHNMTGGAPPSESWAIERVRGTAAAFHAREDVDPAVRLVSFFEVTQPALVLGSAQPVTDVDAAAIDRQGVELVRRRSGGGAVLLVPDEVVWVDVVVPRGDRLWCDDVGRAFHWLGEVWIEALGGLGFHGVSHEGPLACSPWSRRVCFAGVGAGEVLVGGRKVVGISQRRGRIAARFQCAVLRRWDPGAVVGLMAMNELEKEEALMGLREVAAGIDAPADDIETALINSLPR